ncbi:MAG: 2,3-bisphosphoglycerate-independent phosphoglycerate mutase [Gemmatimonadota bacterium]|nr:2,3-bisphosphoglycerate-independent phosphoglycerate mutase [Gemmatimonadota bacterium]
MANSSGPGKSGSATPPVVLIVLDGWGYRAQRDGNAIALAQTPTWDALWNLRSHALLEASGLRVGLPASQMGNSEVGHLNLGAGRVVMQDLVRISTAISDGSFVRNPALVAACDSVRSGGTLHIMGLLGGGGVHAIDAHLYALIDMAEALRVPKIALHLLTDGRDTLPQSALGYLRDLLAYARGRARVASIGGRYFGMDRDRRWQRTELFYRAAVDGTGPTDTDPVRAIEKAYAAGVTDEFMLPVVITQDDRPVAPMRTGDAVICFNYRSDRMRQIVQSLIDPAFRGFDVSSRPSLTVTTLTQYDATFAANVAFAPFSMSRIVAEVISEAGRSILKTAETEKYPHVTYFFNGGLEPPYPGEERRLVPSQQVATYDLAPEMSAFGIADVLCKSLDAREHDFTLCNFANADMVGHTGSVPATITAVETVDRCLARVVESARRSGSRLLITADHGNAEMMIDPATGGVHTAHTNNPVPIVYMDPGGQEPPLREGGALCDVGPTILGLMGIDAPPEMTGVDLFARNDHAD